MFRLLFGYPFTAYAQGKLSLLTGWPRSLLVLAILAGAVLLVWRFQRRELLVKRTAIVLVLQISMMILLFLMVWRPALVVTTAAPRQNIVAVLLDDSGSMSLETPSRVDRVKQVFGAQSPLLKKLAERFQVRTYRFSDIATRLTPPAQLTGSGPSTRFDAAINGVLGDLEGFPLGAVVVVSDGADNSPPTQPDQSALARLKVAHVPLYTVGVGKTSFDRDLQVNDVSVAPKALAGGVISAAVTVHQEGFAGQTANLEVMEGGALLENVPLTFDRPSQTMPVRVNFKPKNKGLRAYTFVLKSTAEADEEIRQNNAQSRVILVEDRKAKILYLEGEPRWDYKFIRRALTDDPAIEMHGLLRTSANKFYRQGMETENVLESGFPKQEELNGYDGVIIGSVEAGFFSAEDAQNLYDYVSRRGGGLLLFGARQSLADGGWQNTNLADLVPVLLNSPAHPSFIRNEAKAALTAYGVDAPMLQLGADAAKTSAAWKSLPLLGDFTRVGEAKPGAVVLATLTPEGERSAYPFIVTQRFGRGRTMLFNSGSSWRWKMERDHTDDTHPRLWRQIARWLIEDTPSNVDVSTDRVLYRDDRHVDLRVEVHNKKYQPVDDAAVTASVTAPDGSKKDVRLEWSSKESGVYTGSYEASVPGIFSVEAKAGDYGEGTTFFERTTGTLEYFDAQQNRALLARMASDTGGKYYPIDDASALGDDVVYSPGGITERSVHELWSIPAFFLLLLMLKGAEWGLRKYWGTV